MTFSAEEIFWLFFKLWQSSDESFLYKLTIWCIQVVECAPTCALEKRWWQCLFLPYISFAIVSFLITHSPAVRKQHLFKLKKNPNMIFKRQGFLDLFELWCVQYVYVTWKHSCGFCGYTYWMISFLMWTI